ncbi:MAG: response regulator [Kofleriaceae bacterium]
MMSDGWVLVLEDNEDLCELLVDRLRRSGLDVRCAVNGALALRMFEERQVPGVVLSDLLMPGVLGKSVLEYMRGEAELRDIPVAIVTGSPQRAPQGYRVFTKPAPFPDVLAFVLSALGRGHDRDATPG